MADPLSDVDIDLLYPPRHRLQGVLAADSLVFRRVSCRLCPGNKAKARTEGGHGSGQEGPADVRTTARNHLAEGSANRAARSAEQWVVPPENVVSHFRCREPTNYRSTRFRDTTCCHIRMCRFQNIAPVKRSHLTDASWEPCGPLQGRLAAQSPGRTGTPTWQLR
jgi:hypothetical protein